MNLLATGVDACDGGDHEVVDVTVVETEAAVIIKAGLRIDSSFYCEVRTAIESFAIELDRPLGRRRVIDDSRGQQAVIWSPHMRADVLRRRQVKSGEAEAFLRSRFPAGESPRCSADGRVRFVCTVGVPSHGKRVEFYVVVRRGGELKALTAELAAERAKEALTRR